MALEFYNAFRNAFDGEPANYWQELRQAAVDDTWFDTSTVRKVQGQTMPGMRTYACESVQVNSVLDPKTGTSLGDNYRKIIYRVFKIFFMFFIYYFYFHSITKKKYIILFIYFLSFFILC